MIVLAAHGTRDPAGPRVITRLAARVSSATGVPVRVAYADVREPDVTTVLRSVRGPAVVVPAFLASGYHVRVDIPAQIEASGHPDVVLTPAFGPAPELVLAVRDRLVSAGYRRGDAVVLAAAGSSDPRALAEVRAAARALSSLLDTRVRIGYAATASPSVAEAVASCSGRVAVASWLLAPGLFQRRLSAAGADVVAEPLGVHAGVVDLVVRRYRQAVARSVAA
ncbi:MULTISPECIES: sirohydrochlorin chelatase [Amycolatopsis]|uniref:Sirohydrochlorin ferrochelatase n=2 Tax=Amycolatopsis TaxID=1813 RepID=A0A1I3XZ83_9PSEU|nr:sirohydrochlorin chelatase [Amycolatopsis sacchari]SFK24296.1 Sirohydrochlorin ferrochelatase [Amycolatopsis sacchari]